MEERVRIALARLLRDGSASLEELASEARTTPEHVVRLLEGFPVRVEGGRVLVESKADLLLEAWRRGVDPVEMALKSGWRDFERVCGGVFERCGYRVLLNVRVRSQGRLFELDVVAVRKPWVLAVDCKRWSRLRSSSLKSAAVMQKERGRALASALSQSLRAEVRGWTEAKVVPLVVNLHEGQLKIYEGVPVVPLSKLVSFLNEFELYEDELFVIPVKLVGMELHDYSG
ncbi:MAG: restriction endonuclease [Thermofilum sp.]|nr:restriction endonuclease [Thermofilum sp.]MCC6065157.1 restriction endonuclease [Thermofilum sp.]